MLLKFNLRIIWKRILQLMLFYWKIFNWFHTYLTIIVYLLFCLWRLSGSMLKIFLKESPSKELHYMRKRTNSSILFDKLKIRLLHYWEVLNQASFRFNRHGCQWKICFQQIWKVHLPSINHITNTDLQKIINFLSGWRISISDGKKFKSKCFNKFNKPNKVLKKKKKHLISFCNRRVF